MPKLIDYPRTAYTGAWEVAEIVDDTGGKCALETSARKLNRKVSGSFKAIVGSAVKFGLLTSKREMLTTTTLFRRIKHAYDKQEELLFHREAFLTPALFTQLCRKFRARELPVAMLDVLLMREFDVEEINAQSVAKAFIDGARMVGLLDEHNIVADIDQLAAQQPPRRELASPAPPPNVFRQTPAPAIPTEDAVEAHETAWAEAIDHADASSDLPTPKADTAPKTLANAAPGRGNALPASRTAPAATADAIASLFGIGSPPAADRQHTSPHLATDIPTPAPELAKLRPTTQPIKPAAATPTTSSPAPTAANVASPGSGSLFTIQLAGPGMNTVLEVTDVEDLALVRALLDKIERRLKKAD